MIIFGAVLLRLSGAADAPDVIILQAALWARHTKSPVSFSHTKHSEGYQTDCAECHHKYEDGANIWVEGDPVAKCQECHNDPTVKDEGKLPEEKKAKNLKLAFHNSCQACHKQLKKKAPQTYEKIPTKCEKCHQEQDAN